MQETQQRMAAHSMQPSSTSQRQSLASGAFLFFRSLVKPMGSLILHRERLDWLFNQVRALQGDSDLLERIDTLSRKESTQVRVLDKISQYLSGAEFPQNDPDYDFYRRYSHLLWNDLIQVVRHKYDPDPKQWKGLALLFCGGGRNISLYRQFVANAGNATGSSVSFSEFENEVPSRMIAPDLLRDDFHRLSVPMALAFSAWVITFRRIRSSQPTRFTLARSHLLESISPKI